MFKFRQCIFAISWLSPLRKGLGPSFEQTWIPFTKGCFVLSLVEIGLVVLEKKIFKIFSIYFGYFFIISPWKRTGPFIWTNLNPFAQGYIVPSFVEIGPVVLEKKSKIGKVYRRTDRQTDDGRKAIRKAHLRFQLRWAKNDVLFDLYTQDLAGLC